MVTIFVSDKGRLCGQWRLQASALVVPFMLFFFIAAPSPLPAGIIAEKIAGGFQFTEGPYWRKAGYLVFSDINGNTVYKWTEPSGAEKLITPSGKSNGIAEDADGRLILAQHEKRQITRIEANGTETSLAALYTGKRLNSPNDLTVRSDGSIYFTDPAYGINSSQEELGFYGVFRYIPSTNTLQLLIDSLKKPNGIIFSLDGSRLYIGDTDKKRIIGCDVQTDGSIKNSRGFAELGGQRYVDGLEVDGNGNIYSAGTVGYIWIISPTGVIIDSIVVPEKTTNLGWGGQDGKTLFITSGTSVYRAQLSSFIHTGSVARHVMKQVKAFYLPNHTVLVREASFLFSEGFEKACIDIFDCKGTRVLCSMPALERSYNGGFLVFKANLNLSQALLYRITCSTSSSSKQFYGKLIAGK